MIQLEEVDILIQFKRLLLAVLFYDVISLNKFIWIQSSNFNSMKENFSRRFKNKALLATVLIDDGGKDKWEPPMTSGPSRRRGDKCTWLPACRAVKIVWFRLHELRFFSTISFSDSPWLVLSKSNLQNSYIIRSRKEYF